MSPASALERIVYLLDRSRAPSYRVRAFRTADECLTSAELSRRARLPQASGYRLIQTLEDHFLDGVGSCSGHYSASSKATRAFRSRLPFAFNGRRSTSRSSRGTM